MRSAWTERRRLPRLRRGRTSRLAIRGSVANSPTNHFLQRNLRILGVAKTCNETTKQRVNRDPESPNPLLLWMEPKTKCYSNAYNQPCYSTIQRHPTMTIRNPMKSRNYRTPATLRTCEGCTECFSSMGQYLAHRKTCAQWLAINPQE